MQLRKQAIPSSYSGKTGVADRKKFLQGFDIT